MRRLALAVLGFDAILAQGQAVLASRVPGDAPSYQSQALVVTSSPIGQGYPITRRLYSSSDAQTQAKVGRSVRRAIKQLRRGNNRTYTEIIVAVRVYVLEEDPPDDTPMTNDEAENKLKKWIQDVALFIIPGIILAVISLLTMIFFFMCRCCCNRCGGRHPSREVYSRMQKIVPVLIVLLVGVAIVVGGASALSYRTTLTTGATQLFNATSETLFNTPQQMTAARLPLEVIRDKVVDVAGQIQVKLEGTDFILDGLTGFVVLLDDLVTYTTGRVLPYGCTPTSSNKDLCFPCLVCLLIPASVSNVLSEMNDTAGANVEQLKIARGSIISLLIAQASSIRSILNDKIKLITNIEEPMNSAHGDVVDARARAVSLGLIGGLFGLAPLKRLVNTIHIGYSVGFVALIALFLVSAVFLGTSAFFVDVCEISAILQKDWTLAVSGDQGKAMNACFRNESLIQVFELEEYLAFARAGIPFPDIQVDQMLAFTQLNAFVDAIRKTDKTTFQIDIAGMLAVLNMYTGQTETQCNPGNKYTKASMLEPWTVTPSVSRNSDETAETYFKRYYATYDTACDPKKGDGKPFQCTSGASPCVFSTAVRDLAHIVLVQIQVEIDANIFIDGLYTRINRVAEHGRVHAERHGACGLAASHQERSEQHADP
ncbi:hypothetical protein Poli38472_011996 [Pythium oligandrum]|uniref:Uncharacterized protein n=1 Tax=Pythium oligandrum TaxID=41045 RepID=A0A8K1CP16_PYTOL|nr:hypothetical protein Poli38472_011996 [Pythium oligandrum]|eukprot:TMW66880.1 hypothetical protein Poli38472_011996 [Pythium oligandrum]